MYLDSVLKTDPYFYMKAHWAETPWINQPDQPIKVSSANDLSDTISPLFGFDPKLLRDWNEEFQVVSKFPSENVFQRIQKERAVYKVYSDFLEAASAGAQAIIEGKLSSMNPNEPLKQQVYVYNSIFFSYAVDLPTSYVDLTSKDNFPSYTQANHDLAGLHQLQSIEGLENLHNLSTCLVHYKGHRIIC